jgi:hypothetical protein
MLNSAIAGVFMWFAFFVGGPEGIDLDTLKKFGPYESMEVCEQSSDTMRDMLTTNEELVQRAIDLGYDGVMTLCTDDPNPFKEALYAS